MAKRRGTRLVDPADAALIRLMDLDLDDYVKRGHPAVRDMRAGMTGRPRAGKALIALIADAQPLRVPERIRVIWPRKRIKGGVPWNTGNS